MLNKHLSILEGHTLWEYMNITLVNEEKLKMVVNDFVKTIQKQRISQNSLKFHFIFEKDGMGGGCKKITFFTVNLKTFILFFFFYLGKG